MKSLSAGLGALLLAWAAGGFGGAPAPADVALALLYTNDTSGVLEPCGCHPVGGLPRRASLIAELRERYPHLLLLDSGNLAQDAERARLILQAMDEMGYHGMGLGVDDLLGWRELLALDPRVGPPVISSLPDLNQLPASVRSHACYQVGDRRVAVLALCPAPAAAPAAELLARLRPLLGSLRQEADLVVLLSQLGHDQDVALARAQAREGWIDLVIGNAEARRLPGPQAYGRTHLLPTSFRGQHVGVVEVRFKGAFPSLAHQRLPVDERYPEQPALRARIQAFQRRQASALRRAAPAADRRADFLSPERCRSCHPEAFRRWRRRPHGRAVESLRRVDRLVPECLPCHSEVFRQTGRFAARQEPADGVGCSVCHGPGVLHALRQGAGPVTRSVGETVCRGCHDEAHDPDFDYPAARAAIRHW